MTAAVTLIVKLRSRYRRWIAGSWTAVVAVNMAAVDHATMERPQCLHIYSDGTI